MAKEKKENKTVKPLPPPSQKIQEGQDPIPITRKCKDDKKT